MKETAQFILDQLKKMTDEIKAGKPVEEVNKEFRDNVSIEQLKYCLTDESMDSDDINTIKEMLKYFFNYEADVN